MSIPEGEVRVLPVYLYQRRFDLTPDQRARADLAVCRLLDDEAWRSGWDADETDVLIAAAYYILHRRAAANADLEPVYRRLRGMLMAGVEHESA